MKRLCFYFMVVIFIASLGLSFQQPSVQSPPYSSVARANHAEPPNAKQESNNTQAVTRKPTITTPGDKDIAPLNAQKETNTDGETTKKEKSKWGVGDKIAIGAIIVYALQFLALFFTYRVMGRSYRDQLDLSRDTAHKQLRAYVLPIAASISPVRAGERPRAIIVARNSGQTPAIKVTQRMYMRIFPYPLNGIEPKYEDVEITSRAHIPTGGKSIQSTILSYEITDDRITDIQGGKNAIYIFGDVQYWDVFGEHHTTTYRYFHNRTSIIQGGALAFMPDKEGNDAD